MYKIKSVPLPIPSEFAKQVDKSGFKQKVISMKHETESIAFSRALPVDEVKFGDWTFRREINAINRSVARMMDAFIQLKISSEIILIEFIGF